MCVESETAAVEEDGCLEVLGVAEAAGVLFTHSMSALRAVEAGVGDAVAQVGEQVRQVALDESGHGCHGLGPTVAGPPVPAREEAADRPGMGITRRRSGSVP